MTKDKMMEMPTKAQILETAKDCPQAKDALAKLFPKAFDEETTGITSKCEARIVPDGQGYHVIHITIDGEEIGFMGRNGVHLYVRSKYEVVNRGPHPIFGFKIFKKK